MLFLALLAAAAAAPAAFADHSATVSIPQGTGVPGCEQTGECFMPADASAPVGGSVTWVNDDSVYHTIRAGDLKYPKITGSDYPNGFQSELLAPGDTFEAANLWAGDYPYYCSLHPWATGMLSVTAANDEPVRESADKGSSFDQTRYDELAREVEDLRDEIQMLRDVIAGQAEFIQRSLGVLYSAHLILADDHWLRLEPAKPLERLPDEDVTINLSVIPLKPSYTLGDVLVITAKIPPAPSEYTRYGPDGTRLYTDERVFIQMHLERRSVLDSTCYIEKYVNCSSSGDYAESLITRSAGVRSDGSILFEGKIAITPDFQAGTYELLVSHNIENENLGIAKSDSIIVRNPTQNDPRLVYPPPLTTLTKVHEIIMPQGTGVPGCEQTECFIPSEVSVAAGSSVTWVNNDSVLHTVWAGDIKEDAEMTGSDHTDGFQSDLINPGDEFTVSDLKEGTYHYYCSLHPWATGTLQVR